MTSMSYYSMRRQLEGPVVLPDLGASPKVRLLRTNSVSYGKRHRKQAKAIYQLAMYIKLYKCSLIINIDRPLPG